MAGVLYVVATPIGNLDDISLRALRVLQEVDLIAAEDTRHTRILLDRHGIRTALISYHEHNEKSQAPRLVERMTQGARVALVADAGTPAISDPGYRLVLAAIRSGISVTPIPGPSAMVAALSASGLPTDRFVFEGFMPAKKGERESRLEALRDESRTIIFYEAPHRLKECLAAIRRILGNRDVVVARELSKVHEEFLRGTIEEIAGLLAAREVKGEVTVLVRARRQRESMSQEELSAEIRRLSAEGSSVREIADRLAERYRLGRREVYQLALRLKRASEST